LKHQEVSAISLLQNMHQDWSAWLVDTGLVDWNTNFTDPARMEWHAKKMESKDTRPAAQMKALGIKPGHIKHVKLDFATPTLSLS
jgi:hypothetical protein